MAITNQDEGVFEHAEFKGLRNTVPSERFNLEDLEAAINVDIDDSLEIARRKGYSDTVLLGTFHSLWSAETYLLAVKDETSLVQVYPDFSFRTLRTGLTPARPMSYVELGWAIGFSNGLEFGIVENGESRSWGINPPNEQPAATNMGGTLVPGRYQYAVTFVDGAGRESGTMAAGSITVTEGGIRFAGLPVSSDPRVKFVRMYITAREGETLYFAGAVVNGTTTFEYSAPGREGVMLRTQFLQPPPAGTILGEFRGIALVARGNVLFVSEPYAFELFDRRKNFPFSSEIVLIAMLDSGIYLSTRDAVYWLNGAEPQKWDLTPKLIYGAIPGTLDYCTADMIFDGRGNQMVAVFATSQGLCVGQDGGQITNITQNRFVYPAQERGAGVIRRHRGMIQYVTSLRGAAGAIDGTGEGMLILPKRKLNGAQ